MKSIRNTAIVPDTTSSIQPSILPIGKCVTIDTLKYSLNSRVPSLMVKNSSYGQKVQQKVNQFYVASSLKTKWLFDNSPNNLYGAVTDALKNAFQYGLRPEDYDVSGIEERITAVYKSDSLSTSEIVDLDVHITEMYFLFTTHLMEGKIRNAGYGKNIWIRERKEYSTLDITLLVETSKPDQLLDAINKLQPANSQYAKLQKALEHYQLLEKVAPFTFPSITVNGKIKPDEKDAAIPLIRKKLSLTESKVYPVVADTLTGSLDSLYYDQILTDAVKFFQVRHGLEPDGIIGERTLKFLNQSFSEKADVIALNMERMRWLPDTFGDNYIVVNVPEYKLRVYENQKQQLEMKVIVGSTSKPTPIFKDELEYIVFSPTWTVPVSIIKEEIIPRLINNPDYYTQRNYSFYKNEVEINPVDESWDDEIINPYEYRIVQNSGPDNSLGLVKFVMSNNMSIYLHDTPNHRPFSKDYRALSHGCIRLDEPARFAEYLLRDQRGWTLDRVSKAMNEISPAAIHLKKHYEVLVEYRTAWVDDDGQVFFAEDIYGHDKMQLQQLNPVKKTVSTFAGL